MDYVLLFMDYVLREDRGQAALPPSALEAMGRCGSSTLLSMGSMWAGLDLGGLLLRDGASALRTSTASQSWQSRQPDTRAFSSVRLAIGLVAKSKFIEGLLKRGENNLGELKTSFDGRSVTYGFGELDTLVPACAANIHKSQGSEYPAVIILVLTHFPDLAIGE
jgi:hypothetical protein